MDPKKTIFLTGATGSIGSYILKIFLENNYKVYALARGNKDKSAEDRIMDALKFWGAKLTPKTLGNLTVVNGDIVYPNLNIKSESTLRLLRLEVEIILHLAALTDFNVSLPIIRKINVEGTKNVLDFSLQCKNLIKINHLSTAYIIGKKTDIELSEDMLDLGQGFNNTYEQTKYEAEVLVKDYLRKGLTISVFRPSMVIGDSKDGKTNNLHLFYEPLHFFSKGIYKQFPLNLKCSMNMINIDKVAKIVFLLCGRKESSTYHLTLPQAVSNLYFRNLFASYFKLKLPQFIPVEQFDFSQWSPAQKILAKPFIPYCNYKTKFLSEDTQKVLKEYKFPCLKIERDNFLRIFQYCDKIGFIKRGSSTSSFYKQI